MICCFPLDGHLNWRGSCPAATPLKTASPRHTKHVANFLFAFAIRRTRFVTSHSVYTIKCIPSTPVHVHVPHFGALESGLSAGEKWKCTLFCLCLPSPGASDALALPPCSVLQTLDSSPHHVIFVLHFHFRFCTAVARKTITELSLLAVKPQIAPSNCAAQSESADFLFSVYLLLCHQSSRGCLLQSTGNLIGKHMLAGGKNAPS